MITPKTLVYHELIGLEVRIADSTNRDIVGTNGIVVDESRNTISIRTKNGIKKFIKDQCVFSFQLPSGERVRVEGKILVARPEDRIKKRFKAW